ncbi:ribosomal RNA small subunit methyltransferase A [mine drainage metagenome]|uniref:Ribosomal RNA small subunit methyltransferase A n=1 Tax=mine drainage metagenome TaxID=410659 RepID=A0A1J5RXJ0_9ZZZZ
MRLGKVNNTLLRVPAYLLFRELIRDPAAIGAICSSSASLARRMATWVDPKQEGWVIELGGGTGAITAALLQHGVAVDKLIVIEKSKRLARHLRARFRGIHVFQGDAADIGTITKGGLAVAAVVSGLPLRSMPADAVSRVTTACAMTLGPKGRLIQFTYWPRTPSAWLTAGLSQAASEMVWGNLPPARVEVFTHSGAFS